VDVLAGYLADEGRVETIMQDVQVLAVQQEYLNRENPYSGTQRGTQSIKDVSYVTLLVTPEESQMLWLAVMQEEEGKVKLTFTVRPVGESTRRFLIPSQLIFPIR
jgi:Flp pilus assembly protein CpaB